MEDRGLWQMGKGSPPKQGVGLEVGTMATHWELSFKLKDGWIHWVCPGGEPGWVFVNRQMRGYFAAVWFDGWVVFRQLSPVGMTSLPSLTAYVYVNQWQAKKGCSGKGSPQLQQ